MTDSHRERRRSAILVAGFSLLIFGGVSVLFLWGPLGSRFDDSRESFAIGFALMGLACSVAAVTFLRPGSGLYRMTDALDCALTEVVGEPNAQFVGTLVADSASLSLVPGLGRFRRSWPLLIVLGAAGPDGVALGRIGRSQLQISLAGEGDEVQFGVGGPGKGFRVFKSHDNPRLRVTVIRADGVSFSVEFDRLQSNVRPLSARDESEVADLARALTVAHASQ